MTVSDDNGTRESGSDADERALVPLPEVVKSGAVSRATLYRLIDQGILRLGPKVHGDQRTMLYQAEVQRAIRGLRRRRNRP